MVHKLLDEMNEQMIIKKNHEKNRCNMMCSATNSEKKTVCFYSVPSIKQ